MENSVDCLRLLQGTQMSFHIFWPQKGLFVIIHLLDSHWWSHGVNIFRTAQLSGRRVNGQGSWVNTNQTIPSSAQWLLWFVPASTQMVSVLGCSLCGWVAGTRPISLPCFRENFLHSLYIGQRGHHRNVAEAFRNSAYSTGPNSSAFLETVGWWVGCSSAANRQALVKVGVWATAEMSQRNSFLTHPMIRRKVLTCRSFMKGSTCRSAAYTAGSYCSMEV